jgi:hypothetical protein
MQRITAGLREYVIGARDIAEQHPQHRRVRGTVAAQRALRPCVGRYWAMRIVRAAVDSATRTDHCRPLSDVSAVALAVELVDRDRLYLYEPLPRPAYPLMAAAAAPAPAARPSASSSSTRQNTEETFASSFRDDVDAAALAGSLRDAAQDGTPFCEECARAARAA